MIEDYGRDFGDLGEGIGFVKVEFEVEGIGLAKADRFEGERHGW